jgi:hypothetical protein
VEKFAGIQRLTDNVYRGTQKRKRRPRGIQTAEPSAQRGRIGQTLGIFGIGRRGLPVATFHKVAPQRLTASDEAVVGIGWGERRQERERLAAQIAEAAPNGNPVMIFVMRLFAPAAMTDDRIPQTNRAVAKDRAPTRFDPIDFEVVLCGRK